MNNTPLPACNWAYFATPARGSWTVTSEFVTEARLIIRNVYNSQGLRIANVRHLEPGHKILLAYGGSGKPYRPLFRATIAAAADPVRSDKYTFDVFGYVNESLADRLRESDYVPDPVIHKFVGIAIDDMHDLRNCMVEIRRPSGNNTLWRWDEVFPT